MELNQKIPKNPRKWRYTWEALSHSPNLRLFLFDSCTIPSLQCKNLNACFILAQSQLLVTWIDGDEDGGEKEREEAALSVPVPRVLIDADSPVNFRAFDDHIEIKLVLLLPVDHPLVFGSDSVLDSSSNGENPIFDVSKPLVMDYDSKSLSSEEGVHFYCRSCSSRLTRDPLCNFSEMPSVNWREVADNWFGTCCCSFGGISERLVAKYVNSYTCAKGLCLLSHTTVTLSKDDLEECCKLSESNGIQEHQFEPFSAHKSAQSKVKFDSESGQDNGTGRDDESKNAHDFMLGHMESITCTENLKCGLKGEGTDPSNLCLIDETLVPVCCDHGTHDTSESSPLGQKFMNVAQLASDKKFLLNGFLEDVFMARPFNLSRNIDWVEFTCYNCSCVLGAYPSGSGNASIDGGVQLFKCYISTSLPAGGPGDLFRKYSLERMITNQLVESAKDELSFRVVVKDLATKTPVLQVILFNPNTWSCTGYCLSRNDSTEPASKAELSPVVKVLFSECSNSTESQQRVLGNRAKDLADEVCILRSQAEKLVDLLSSAHEFLPPSCACLQGLPVSSMQR